METLSDKKFKVEVPGAGWIWVVSEENVKQFIKELKMRIPPCDNLIVEINKLAGDKLI